MNELTPRGHLRPLGGRENPRRARPESRSPRRCASAWRRCLLSAGRPEGIDQGTHDRHARARPHPQLHMRKGVNRNPSRRPELADSDSNLHAVKMTQNWALLTPPLSRAAGPSGLNLAMVPVVQRRESLRVERSASPRCAGEQPPNRWARSARRASREHRCRAAARRRQLWQRRA